MNIFSRNVPNTINILNNSTIGIAGCGGLGSNVAVSLVRAGIGKLIIADFDTVSESNLNRQYYFIDNIGKPKVIALTNILKRINPKINITAYNKELNRNDIALLYSDVYLMIDAFDKAESKQWLVEEWNLHYPDKPIICGNGISGIGKFEELKINKVGNVYFCGDEVTNSDIGLCSARVSIVANMQANLAIEILISEKE